MLAQGPLVDQHEHLRQLPGVAIAQGGCLLTPELRERSQHLHRITV